MTVLEMRDVYVEYMRSDGAPVRAVAGVDLSIDAGEIVGLVGETGCGKSSLARAACGLTPVASGSVLFQGQPVQPLGYRARPAAQVRLQMVFQNPYGSLNPRRRIGDQLADGLRGAMRRERRERVPVLLGKVGLPGDAASRFPHQLSGGQRQRAAIARALATDPSVIILDEPLSALDASVQAQVANLLSDLARDLGVGMLLISHDLAIVRHVAQRTAVMYLGKISEFAPTRQLWDAPMHPYSRALIGAIPAVDSIGRLPNALVGEVPDPARPPGGCRFHPRCPYVMDMCRARIPPAFAVGRDHTSACWLSDPALASQPSQGHTSVIERRSASDGLRVPE
ncbi:MAG: ABC transporter ATP-binding protein [Chloroflexota bacterium]